MSLPQLYVLPQSEDDWRAWSWNHAAIHYTVLTTINRTKSLNLEQFILDPIQDFAIWGYWHQFAHNQANAALGISGYDLLEFDLEDPGQLQTWLNLNGSEHQNWNRILGV